MKRILILEPNATGGKKLVETARKLGYLVYGVTQKNVFEKFYEENFKIKFEDIYFTDFSNEEECIEGICRYATQQNIDAVLSGFEFMSNFTVTIASRLNLLTHDPRHADALRNKALMNECFVKNNVPAAKTIVIDSFEQLKEHENTIIFPIIIKPADNAGSCGVFKANNFKDLIHYYNVITENTTEFPHGFQLSKQVLLQEVLEGNEYSVEIAISNGQAKVICVTDKITTKDNYFAELGHILPSAELQDNQNLISKVACESVKALGLQNGVAHVELKFTDEGPKIIEVGARLPGDYIPELIELALGIDEAEIYLQTVLGDSINLTPIKNEIAVIRFIPVPYKGEFKAMEFLWDSQNNDFSFLQYVKKGDIVSPSKDNISRLGHIICTGQSYESVSSKCSEILNSVKVEIL